MYFEDIATRDLPALPIDHKFRYLEDVLKKHSPLKKKEFHDKEHEEMLKEWGCDPKHTSKLTIRFDEKGQAFADRMYHIVLHLRYWKDKNIEELVQHALKFEEESGYSLDDLTLPSPSGEGEQAY